MIYMSNIFKQELMEITNKMNMDGKLREEVSKKISMVIASLTSKAQKALLV